MAVNLLMKRLAGCIIAPVLISNALLGQASPPQRLGDRFTLVGFVPGSTDHPRFRFIDRVQAVLMRHGVRSRGIGDLGVFYILVDKQSATRAQQILDAKCSDLRVRLVRPVPFFGRWPTDELKSSWRAGATR